jgi:hypothetical protein
VRRTKIIHEMNDQMRAATLPRKPVMFRIKLMTVKSESEFHRDNYRGFRTGSKMPFYIQI